MHVNRKEREAAKVEANKIKFKLKFYKMKEIENIKKLQKEELLQIRGGRKVTGTGTDTNCGVSCSAPCEGTCAWFSGQAADNLAVSAHGEAHAEACQKAQNNNS